MNLELESLLQECTVKITVPNKRSWGTGFFVAPGLILTCAHVVKNLDFNDKANIQLQKSNKFADAKIEQLVPQADLALLRVISPSDLHLPCVYLDRAFQPGDKLYFFGYPEKDFYNGCPTTVICEGSFHEGTIENDVQLIKFNAGQVQPGMSGSALFNFRTSKICGIVKFTRDPSFDLGGGAISISTVLKKLPQLHDAQNQFHSRDYFWSNLIDTIHSENISVQKLEITKDISDESLKKYLATAFHIKPNRKFRNLEGTKISLKDLYVPLYVREYSSWNHGINSSTGEGTNIHRWVKDLLISGVDEIILIQGESGQGKSAFCEVFAEELSKEPDLDFIPVLIRLQEIKEVKEDLWETLQPCLKCHMYFLNNHHWLVDTSLKFLILLDGLDELMLSAKEIKDFIEQILKFQEETHNQFLITGRYFLPQVINDVFGGSENVLLGRIQLMNRPLQETWIKKWSLAISNRIIGEGFKAFLYGSKDDDGSIIQASCPKDITQKLAGEPMSMFLLASLFQIDKISKNDFLTDDGFDGRVKVYQHVLNQTLNKVVKSKNKSNNNTITSELLESILMKAAAYYIQADGQAVNIAQINKEFKETQNKGSDLYSLLASFYVRPQKPGDKIEFTHRSFGEFLFAKYIKKLLSLDITQPNSTKAISEDIYQALGFGLLTNEIIRFFVTIAKKDDYLNSDPENFLCFFYQLYDYYWNWCEGSYVECPRRTTNVSGKDDNSAKNVAEIREQHIYVGLNLILLTLEIYRYLKTDIRFRQVSFHFCEKFNDHQSKDEDKLLRIIGFTYLLKGVEQVKFARQNFVGAIGDFLYGIDLSGINLQGVDLSNANFCGSTLKGAVLSNTNLSEANFMFSDLSGADLSGCNLVGARIEGANLSDAKLVRANLGNLNLREAAILPEDFFTNMTESDRESLKKINFDFDSLNLQDEMNFENLKGITLDSASLSNFNFEGLSLRQASLSNLVLDGSNFKNADLRDVNLKDTSLQNANLQNVDLRNAELRNVNFRHANLQDADLRKTILINSSFRDADLKCVIFRVDEDQVLKEDEALTIDEANDCFENTDFSKANLTATDFGGLDLTEIDFEGANLSRANFKKTALEGACFFGADLSYANLEAAYLENADLRNSNLSGARLSQATLRKVEFNSYTFFQEAIGLESARDVPAGWQASEVIAEESFSRKIVLDSSIEEAVIAFAIEQPCYGRNRTSEELGKRGISITPAGVRTIWRRYGLQNFLKRVKALEIKAAQENLILTKAQIQAIEKFRQES